MSALGAALVGMRWWWMPGSLLGLALSLLLWAPLAVVLPVPVLLTLSVPVVVAVLARPHETRAPALARGGFQPPAG